MRTALKSLLGWAWAATGGPVRLHAGRLAVLTFHRVRPDGEDCAGRPMRNLDVDVSDFRRILAWMKERYEPVRLADWLAAGRAPARPSFAATFDDGWEDNRRWAYPVLEELGIPATIFLSTGAVDERQPFWWQHAGLTDREIEKAKDKPPVALGEPRAAEDFLTWEQAREMAAGGLVQFGAHGHRHELLTNLTKDEAAADARKCWDLMRARLPAESLVPALAWPNGNAREDMGDELESMGLRAAFGTGRGAAGKPGEARWNLPRNNVDRGVAGNAGLLPWLLMRAR